MQQIAPQVPVAATPEAQMPPEVAAEPLETVAPETGLRSPPEPLAETADMQDDLAPASDGLPAQPEPPPENALAPEQALEALLHTEELDDELARSRASFQDDALADTDSEAPGFLRDAERQSVWHRPRVRSALQLGSFLLALGLGLQVLMLERDRVAAQAPHLLPVLRGICVVTGCELGPLRQIESVAVDSSAFTKLRPDVFRLSFVLKNNASSAVAMPAVELSLTDAREQAVVRRVVLPAEFGAPRPVLAAGAEFPANITVAMVSGVDGAAVTGYRLLAFYP